MPDIGLVRSLLWKGNIYGTIRPMTVRVEEYLRANGSCPFRQWADGLSREAAVKVAFALFRIRQGHRSRLKWFDGIGEYRIDWGPGCRISLIQDGPDLILLLGGGTKQRQRADIRRAQQLRAEYLSQERAR